jgi:hypothetical protein
MVRVSAAFSVAVAVVLVLPGACVAQTFTDGIGDSGTAPDITAVDATFADGRLTFKIHTPSEPTQSPDSLAFVAINTDNNLQTGSEAGDEVAVDVYSDHYESYAWNGVFWEAHTHPSLRVAYSSGAIMSMTAADLGNPARITFWASTVRGQGLQYGTIDWAPDQGAYSFTLEASDKIELDSEARPSTPRAGRPFRLSVVAMLAETGDVVEPESIRCTARLGGLHATIKVPGRTTPLTGRGTTGCSWQIPRTARGKKLLVTMVADYHGSTTTAVKLFRIR